MQSMPQKTVSHYQMIRLVLVGLVLMATCSVWSPLHLPSSLAVTSKSDEKISVAKASPSSAPLLPAQANPTENVKKAPALTQPEAFPVGLYPTWLASQQTSAGPDYTIAQTSLGEWQANNPAHQIEATFNQQGLKLNGTWGLALTGLGYQGQALQQIGITTKPQITTANRLEYQRQAGLVEWYVNGPMGLEQGFTLNQPWPSLNEVAGTAEAWLNVELHLDGGKAVNLTRQTEEVSSSSWLTIHGSEEKLLGKYGGLYAYDATGRKLESILEVVGQEAQTIRLSVKIQGATYPLVIDPFVQQAELTASNGLANDYFATSVSLSSNGNTALIGVPGKNNNQGTAYAFTRSGGVWSQHQEILHSNVAANDNFGSTVSLSGDGNTAFIGAPGKNNNEGAVYIFLCSGDVWGQLQMLTSSDAAIGDYFGSAVSLSSDGNTALIGANEKTVSGNQKQGAAYIFTRNDLVWNQQQKLIASDGADIDWFGYVVSLSNDGNTALIGAPYKDIVSTNDSQGAAYIFVRSGTVWTQRQRFTANDAAIYDNFGQAVSLSGDGKTVLIGAYEKNFQQGAGYIFIRSGGIWSFQQEITANDAGPQNAFALWVSLSSNGNTALIGAPYKPFNNNSNQGAAYVFTRNGTTWSQQQEITDTNGTTNDFFGFALSLSGDGNTAVVGAQGKTVGNNSKQGAAFAYSLLKAVSTINLASSPNPSNAGQSVVFTATVTPITATGTVSFKEGAVTVGTATLANNGIATFTTGNLTAGSHVISATYEGDFNTVSSSSGTITQVVTACGLPLVVTSNADDGTCGTLRSEIASATAANTITITLAAGSTISLTGGTGLVLPQGVSIVTTAACDANGPGITIQGVGLSSGDGVILSGQNSLYNLWIRGFSGRQLVALGGGNSLSCIRATKT